MAHGILEINSHGFSGESPASSLRMNSSNWPPEHKCRNPGSCRQKKVREVVQTTIPSHCRLRDWTQHKVNARLNHVHVVVTKTIGIPRSIMLKRHKTAITENLSTKPLRVKLGVLDLSTRWRFVLKKQPTENL